MTKRQMKKKYSDLFDHPHALFGNGPNNTGARVTLWPNDENELWIQDASGQHSVKITASNGPAGLGITIHQHVGATPMTVRAYGQDYALPQPSENVREVCITMYNADERSQAFKRWYDQQETETDLVLLGSEYRRKTDGAQ